MYQELYHRIVKGQLKVNQKILDLIEKYLKKATKISPEERQKFIDDIRLL